MKRVNSKSTQRGLTLLEILIAMSLGAFMLVGIISLMASVSATRTELDRTSELSENGRYAIQILSDEISLAGYMGPFFNSNIDYTVPDPCDDGSTLTNLGIGLDELSDTDGDGNLPDFPVAVQGFGPSISAPTCFTTTDASIAASAAPLVGNSEVLVVRRVDANSIAAASAVAGDLYLQFSSNSADANEFVFANTVGSFTLRDEDGNTAPVWPYIVRAFFISSCDDCAGGDTIPTLKVMELSNDVTNPPEPRSLVEGVEDIHFEYGMDLDGNGAPDCYVADPRVDTAPAGCTAGPWSAVDAENFANVVAVQVAILVRSLSEFPGWNDNKTYDLGETARVGPFNDEFKRRVFRSVVLIQNVSGVRE